MTKIPLMVGILVILLLAPLCAAIGGEEGWIEVRCNVDGSSVLFDGTYKGEISGGSLTVPVYTTATPFRDFTVQKPGYEPFTGSLTMPQAGQTVTVYATLNPTPTQPTLTPVQYGSIYVETSPSGAGISFNGDYRGTSPITINDIWPGSYTITAEKSGYNTYTTTTSVSSGTRSSVYCPLTPMNTAGSLYVISDPAGSNIYLDANYKGKTPMTINNIATGTHILEIDHAGYYDWKSTVSVPYGGTKTISATLNPMPVSSVGWLYISSSPGGASVTLDGGPVGQTPYSGSLKLSNIAAGTHTVTLTLPGYSVYTTSASVTPSTVSEVNAILSGTTPVSSSGALAVSSTPAGANVFLDNSFVGITPLTMQTVATGTHTVTIRLTGYQDYMVTTPVNAGATSTVAAALQPETTPTPHSALPLVVVIGALFLAGIVASRKGR